MTLYLHVLKIQHITQKYVIYFMHIYTYVYENFICLFPGVHFSHQKMRGPHRQGLLNKSFLRISRSLKCLATPIEVWR